MYSGKTRLDTLNWVPAQGQRAGLELAILIDNSASQFGVGSQLNELAGFMSLQSKNTAIGVFYAQNGTVQTAAAFTTNHEAAAKALRIPFGPHAGASPSVYLSLSDLIRNRWPVSGARREVLLISSGVDRMDRGPQSPYVSAAIEDAQKGSVVVHAIYTDGVRFGDTQRGQYAQTNLIELAQGSGGYNLYEGISTPVSFAPYLKQLDMALHNQYLLTFAIERRSRKEKGEIRPIEVRTEQRSTLSSKYPKLMCLSPALPLIMSLLQVNDRGAGIRLIGSAEAFPDASAFFLAPVSEARRIGDDREKAVLDPGYRK